MSDRESASEVSGDREIVGLARGGGLNLLGAAFSQVVMLGTLVVLARRLGRDDIGLYTQAYAFLSILNLLAMSGFRAGLTRFVAVHRVDRDAGAVRGTVHVGIGVTVGFAVCFAAALHLAAPWLARTAFDDVRLLTPLRYVAWTLPFATFMESALAATQGFKTMKPFALIALILEPAFRLALTWYAIETGRGIRGAMVALLVSHAVGAVLAAGSLRRLLGPNRERAVYRPRELFTFSTASWLASLASTGLLWADTILLGIYRSSADVGVYNAATRMVMLATFVMAPINASFAPRIADLYRRGAETTLRRAYGVATSWIVRLSLPAFILVIVFPDDLLALFGRAFAAGATVTIVLAVGKLIDAGTGPCGLMLNMSGRPVISMVDNLAALVLNVVLNVWLIPRHGILGSAVAWALSLGAVNVARVFQVWRILGMLPFDTGVAKGALAGLVAFASAVVVNRVVNEPLALVVGAAAVAVTYVAAVFAAGVTAEDRLVLRDLTGRVLARP